MNREPQITVVPAQSGRAVQVPKGSLVTVRDVAGHQVGDMWCIVPGDPQDWLSVGQTRTWCSRDFPQIGEYFYSYRSEKLLRFIDDTSPGTHDMLYPPCDAAFVADIGRPGQPNCQANFFAAIEEIGLGLPFVPDPVNIFQNTLHMSNGGLDLGVATSKAGDKVTFEAMLDVIVVLTACSVDQGYATNNWNCTDLELIIG